MWFTSGIFPPTCDRIKKEFFLRLPGGFTLPIGIEVDVGYDNVLAPVALSREAAEKLLAAASDKVILQKMIAGSIQTRGYQIAQENGLSFLHGIYGCNEMIGRFSGKEDGTTNGKIDG